MGTDDVVFLFTFDFNSSVLRKNPLGVVEAYRRAFGTDPVATRLVIKAINLANSPTFEADLRAAVASVHGVVIDEHLTAGELGDVFHATDVYVSLHRSEGFGLGLAEAMALGKAVVGTAYSGNVDFMHGGNSALVGFRLRPVVPDDHRYSGAVGTVYRPGFLPRSRIWTRRPGGCGRWPRTPISGTVWVGLLPPPWRPVSPNRRWWTPPWPGSPPSGGRPDGGRDAVQSGAGPLDAPTSGQRVSGRPGAPRRSRWGWGHTTKRLM